MEEFKNIIKVINDKLAENERVIEYYLNESVSQKDIAIKNASLKKRVFLYTEDKK